MVLGILQSLAVHEEGEFVVLAGLGEQGLVVVTIETVEMSVFTIDGANRLVALFRLFHLAHLHITDEHVVACLVHHGLVFDGQRPFLAELVIVEGLVVVTENGIGVSNHQQGLHVGLVIAFGIGAVHSIGQHVKCIDKLVVMVVLLPDMYQTVGIGYRGLGRSRECHHNERESQEKSNHT